MKKTIIIILFVFIFVSLSSVCFAKEKVTILISGQSHASLYPCTCPHNPEGGVSRRSTAIKQIKNQMKNVLLLEAGLSFSGGKLDTKGLDQEKSKKVSEAYLKALSKMKYDAFLISSEEFNFGDDFLREMIKRYPLNYLSANVGKKEFKPYVIKRVAGKNIAIIGLSDEGVKEKTKKAFVRPRKAIEKVIKEISKGKKADFVVVLSSLDLKQSEEIIKEVKGIDLWVSSNNPYGQSDIKKIDGVTIVVPRWEARQLTRLDYVLEGDSIELSNSDSISLNKDIEDDKGISSMIPVCLSDKDCMKSGVTTRMICENAATDKAQCKEFKAPQVSLYIIKPKKCVTCSDVTSNIVGMLKQGMPDLKIVNLTDDKKKAKELIKELDVKMLPVYVLDETLEQQPAFPNMNAQVVKKVGKYYRIDPSISGVSYFVGRKVVKNRLDVFFDIASPGIADILAVLDQLKERNKNIDVNIHLLAIEDAQGNIFAKSGQYEIEEYLRFACINKYFPEQFRYYLSCRLPDVRSSWWDDCATKFKIDTQKIKSCAQTKEGRMLLREFIKLTKELEIVFGPTFVINNNEIFGVSDVPRVEELEKLFKK